MTRLSLYLLVYGVILIVGGFAGYSQANSMISLIAGVGSGIAIILLSVLITFEKPYAHYIAFALTLMLTIVFGIRFGKTHAFHNAALCLLSAYVTFLCLLRVCGKGRFE